MQSMSIIKSSEMEETEQQLPSDRRTRLPILTLHLVSEVILLSIKVVDYDQNPPEYQ